MKIIIVPDEGEWVLVPRKALEDAEESLGSFVSDHGWRQEDMDNMDRLTSILVNPPCKVVELPERKRINPLVQEKREAWQREGWNACLDEIERRAK